MSPDPKKSESTFELERGFDVPITRLWTAWTDPEELSRWLALRAHVEPVVGGAYELFWDPEHPERNSTLGCRVLALEDFRLLAFSWRGPVQFAGLMNGEPPPTQVRIEFRSEDDRTWMRLIHSGWGEGPAWDEARSWFEQVWAGALGKLADILRHSDRG